MTTIPTIFTPGIITVGLVILKASGALLFKYIVVVIWTDLKGKSSRVELDP